jgi:hypothetical protein
MTMLATLVAPIQTPRHCQIFRLSLFACITFFYPKVKRKTRKNLTFALLLLTFAFLQGLTDDWEWQTKSSALARASNWGVVTENYVSISGDEHSLCLLEGRGLLLVPCGMVVRRHRSCTNAIAQLPSIRFLYSTVMTSRAVSHKG